MVSLSNHVANVHVLIRGDLSKGGGLYCYGSRTEGHLERDGFATEPYGDKAAHYVVTHDVSGQKSAKVIVAQCPG
ncbi:MAG: hypothetical protein HWN70_14470 [Desulfobacterales bacterium]|nr:hypothetical protein [Desulfobacterales bacterium]